MPAVRTATLYISMKKVLITGANGLLGQRLVTAFAKSFDITATARQERLALSGNDVRYRQLDITNAADCKSIAREVKPDVIVNAAAFTNVDGCENEREQCWRVNVKGVENLAAAARKNMALLVQISTDYIFDGNNGPYSEQEPPNPIGYYGKAKLAAENVVRISSIPFAIVRTNVIYGTGVDVKNNFALWVYHSLKAGKEITVVTDQYNNPTLADELTEGIRLLIKGSKYGVFHIAGGEYINRFDFACKIAEVFGFSKALIRPITSAALQQTAPRPMRGGLLIDHARSTLGFDPLSLKENLEILKQNLE